MTDFISPGIPKIIPFAAVLERINREYQAAGLSPLNGTEHLDFEGIARELGILGEDEELGPRPSKRIDI